MKTENLISIFERAKGYAKWANQAAESRHDDMDGEYYMDGAQYEIMKETEELINDIDSALKELGPK